MKRRNFKFIVCSLIITFALAITACGGSDEKTTDAVEAEDVGNDKEIEAAEDAEVAEAEEEERVEDEGHLYPDSAYEPLTDGMSDEEADAAMDLVDSLYEADKSGAMTLEDYFGDPSVKSAFESMVAGTGQQGVDITLEVSGNNLVMIFQITDSAIITEDMAENLATELDGVDFSSQLEAFDNMVGEAGACTVTMRYLNSDGDLLAEHTYGPN